MAETAGIYYEEAGEGPALIMLHGSGPGVSGQSNFGANQPVFARHFRTIVIDMPGFGVSPAMEWTKPYPEHAADALVAFMDALGIDKAHLLGNSMGGNVALETAYSYPDRVARMVLMGPGGLSTPLFGPQQSEGVRRLTDFFMNPSREAMKAWVDTMVSAPGIVDDELIEKRTQMALDGDASARMMTILMSLGKPSELGPLFARLHKIKHPTLITWGRDDRMLPLETGMWGARQMRNADMHIFSTCAHWAQVERKDEFEALSIDYLSRG